jgi:phage terminase small subunit
MTSTTKLTTKQEVFIQEYLVDLNATQAAIRAGYSAKNADVIAIQNLGKLRKPIQEALEKRREKTVVTAEYVLFNLRKVVERCLQATPVTNFRGQQVVDKDGNNVWEFNAAGANKALELLGKHLGMFTEKIQMDVTVSPARILQEIELRRTKPVESTPLDVIDVTPELAANVTSTDSDSIEELELPASNG